METTTQSSRPKYKHTEKPLGVLPNLKIIKIGGQSIMDRGAKALMPLRDEIIEASKKHSILLCSGGGTRARHAYSLGIDLKLPTGVMAAIGAAVPRQNARMLQMLLAEHGGIYIMPDDIEKLPLYLKMKCIPILGGMPPFTYWEKPARSGTIPEHRTDSGPFLLAEFFGCPEVYFVKDEDGLYTDDPKKNSNAKLIPEITAKELIARDLPDLALERVVVEDLEYTRSCKRVRILNGLVKGNLLKALDGQPVGSVIRSD
jgi:molybdenum storage protein